jgi:hypothetical protein
MKRPMAESGIHARSLRWQRDISSARKLYSVAQAAREEAVCPNRLGVTAESNSAAVGMAGFCNAPAARTDQREDRLP